MSSELHELHQMGNKTFKTIYFSIIYSDIYKWHIMVLASMELQQIIPILEKFFYSKKTILCSPVCLYANPIDW